MKIRIIFTLGPPLSPYHQAEQRWGSVPHCLALAQEWLQNPRRIDLYQNFSIRVLWRFWNGWEAVLCSVGCSAAILTSLIDAIITLLPSCDNQKWVQSCQMSLEGSGGAEVASVENHIWPLRTRRIGQSQYKLPILMAAGTVSLIQCLSRILEGYITSQAGKLLTWVSSEYVFKIRLLFILPRKSFAFS